MNQEDRDAADSHRSRARRYLEEAQAATDPARRQELVNLCEQELAAAAAARIEGQDT